MESFRGHLLLSFLTSVAYIMVNNILKKTDVCAIGAYRILRNLKCKVFDSVIVVQEANKKMNDIAKQVKLKFPKLSCPFPVVRKNPGTKSLFSISLLRPKIGTLQPDIWALESRY